MWRTRFGRGFGPVVRQTSICINYVCETQIRPIRKPTYLGAGGGGEADIGPFNLTDEGSTFFLKTGITRRHCNRWPQYYIRRKRKAECLNFISNYAIHIANSK
jgi:hypothetical protein